MCTDSTEGNSTVATVVIPTDIDRVPVETVLSGSGNNVHNDGGRLEVIGFVDDEGTPEYKNGDVV